jgi:hypothetical protein
MMADSVVSIWYVQVVVGLSYPGGIQFVIFTQCSVAKCVVRGESVMFLVR